ncbi:MAG: hypothetical protein ACTSSE_06155 [Candidatus Thorarchaeota archaeon]
MKLNYKHAICIAIAAANAGEVVVAQEIGEEFLFSLLEDGAEIVFASIDAQGVPAVVYGQLGIPADELGLNQTGAGQMYEGCVAMALLATQGELLDYILDLIGDPLLNLTGDEGTMDAAQFGGEGGFDLNSILDMIGTDFSLLINIFIDLTDAQAQANMGAIRTHLHTNFEFTFAEILDLRIDESFFPPEMEFEFPFDGINIFVHQVTNEFETAISSVLSVMDQSGFLGAIDQSVFTDARASGAGLLAVPDMGYLMDLIEGFGGGEPENMTASTFLLSQLPDLDGPIALAGAGYIGDQSTTSDEIKVFEDLLGKDPLTNINGLDSGQSLVAVMVPEDVNVTSYTPEDEAQNRTYYQADAGLVFWNATAYTNQNDYIVNFEPGSFPPLIKIARFFNPVTLTTGGSVQVTVGVHNEGVDPIYNLTLTDTGFASIYPDIAITGTQSTTSSVLDAGDWLNITYTLTFINEGGYVFPAAEVTYEFENNTYSKTTHVDGYTVSPDLVGLLSQMISEGMPYTGIIIGVVGLGAIVNIGLMARGRGGGGSYQV